MRPALLIAAGLGLALAQPSPAPAAQVRQYFDTTWQYNSNASYYYVRYYYQPAVTYTTYDYHYCIYYPSQPSYIYYYNPTTSTYWGRYKIGSKGDERYSKLEEKDRKKNLKQIPEEAFPKPAKMPVIPGAKDDVEMLPPPENVPKEAPPAP